MERENDYVKEWLGAYLDGQLSAERRAWVEDHLAGCSECQADLAGLRALSALLHADPAPDPVLTGEAFTGLVLEHLRRPAQPFGRRALRLSLRYTPLALFAVWAFFQAVILVSSGLLLALPYFPQAQAWLSLQQPVADAGGWLGELTENAFFGPLALIELAVSVLVALIFLAWLAALWSHRRTRSTQSA